VTDAERAEASGGVGKFNRFFGGCREPIAVLKAPVLKKGLMWLIFMSDTEISHVLP